MIYSISGKLTEKNVDDVVITAAGVGYFISMPSSAVAALPAIGGECTVYTYMNVKEDAVDLYGFTDKSMRSCFKMLLGVSGVGPKVALGMLSALSPAQILISISAGDYKAFTKCPGVGPKLAQRMVLELKDKAGKNTDFGGQLAAVSSVAAASPASAVQKAVQALMSLGYAQSEAAAAVARQPEDASLEDLIRLSLKALAVRR